MDHRPIDFRVLNLARGVAGACATRLLSDFGAQCSWRRGDDARPGDRPQSAAFQSNFEQRVERLNSQGRQSGVGAHITADYFEE